MGSPIPGTWEEAIEVARIASQAGRRYTIWASQRLDDELLEFALTLETVFLIPLPQGGQTDKWIELRARECILFRI